MINYLLIWWAFLLSSMATYTLWTWDVANIWTAATDVANSLFWMLADLLPILIPVIVVMFWLWFVIWMIKRR